MFLSVKLHFLPAVKCNFCMTYLYNSRYSREDVVLSPTAILTPAEGHALIRNGNAQNTGTYRTAWVA